MRRIIGIDLGTTNSAAAFLENGEAKIIPNDRGNRITPSIVAFPGEEDVLVGEAAKNQAIVNAARTILSIKRFMGSGSSFTVYEKPYSPAHISSLILRKLKRDAENYFGEEIDEAVITVPAYFSENKRRDTREAGRLAGLTVRRIINEPTAAALSYAYDIETNSNILVYDLGGGTFDVTFLEKAGDNFTVKSSCGDNNLGGNDFDKKLLDMVVKEFSEEAEIDLSKDKIVMQQLLEQVERAKIELSSRSSAQIALPFIAGNGGPVHLSYTVTRDGFEDLIREDIDTTIELALQAVKDAGASPADVQSLILSGGSSRIPLVRNLLSAVFAVEPEKRINPEEVVALGAAVQASMISGEVENFTLQDITPLPLGLEIEGGRFLRILNKNTPIPAKKSKVFTTVSDNQKSVEIHVLQGEEGRAAENNSLGKFLLSGIRSGKKGEPRIKVNFCIDQDGLLHVGAKDVDTGVEQLVSMTAGFGTEEKNDGSLSSFADLKKRLKALTERTETLSRELAGGVDRGFKREIDEMIKNAKAAVLKRDDEGLREMVIALETIIGELNAITQIEEELTG